MTVKGAEVSDLLSSLRLEPTEDGWLTAWNIEGVGEGDVVFGGQIAAQAAIASGSVQPSMTLQSIDVLFIRPAFRSSPLDVQVEPLQRGRTFASAMVSFHQGGRLCARSLALLENRDPDLIRHSAPVPDTLGGPDEGAPEPVAGGVERRVLGGVSHSDADSVHPPNLQMWARLEGAPDDPLTNQAILCFATAGLLIGTAMLPHPGVGTSMAHNAVSTGILAHRVHFHEEIDFGDWVLVDQESPFAGHGRTFGLGRVYSRDGGLAASFSQDNIVRKFPDDTSTFEGRTVL